MRSITNTIRAGYNGMDHEKWRGGGDRDRRASGRTGKMLDEDPLRHRRPDLYTHPSIGGLVLT